MRAGDLRHLVTLQSLVAASPDQKATGEPDTTWTDWHAVHAAVEPLRGRELIAAQALQSDVDTRIRIRYRAGVSAAMRVVFGTRHYDIVTVIDPSERHIELQLMCRQGASDG